MSLLGSLWPTLRRWDAIAVTLARDAVGNYPDQADDDAPTRERISEALAPDGEGD